LHLLNKTQTVADVHFGGEGLVTHGFKFFAASYTFAMVPPLCVTWLS
jgi:hypothetical protein